MTERPSLDWPPVYPLLAAVLSRGALGFGAEGRELRRTVAKLRLEADFQESRAAESLGWMGAAARDRLALEIFFDDLSRRLNTATPNVLFPEIFRPAIAIHARLVENSKRAAGLLTPPAERPAQGLRRDALRLLKGAR